MYKRQLDLANVLKRKSVFLFGPRQTGKSTWLRATYPNALYIDLLSPKVFSDYATRANALESDLTLFSRKKASNMVIIDEVQKLPALLDAVHEQIERHKQLRFILTGSSARKLRRGGANLLGGRASWREMFPLVYPEMKAQLATLHDVEQRILRGGLPHVFDSQIPSDDLDDYVQLYLNEEIKAEGLVRNHEAFHRFLHTAALCNAKQINFTAIGSDAQIPPRTVHDYFSILEDTLIGMLLPAFTKTSSRKAMTSAKFYLFDTGVVNSLVGRTTVHAATTEFGDLFEQYVITEVRAYNSYGSRKAQLSYWRTTSQFEVDLIVETHAGELIAIEIKSKVRPTNKDFKGLRAFSDDYPSCRKILVTPEGRHALLENGIEVLPLFEFFSQLWSGELF
jgi:predicted AAA+ superfamily ATPase